MLKPSKLKWRWQLGSDRAGRWEDEPKSHTLSKRPGFSGADLANVINEAALLSSRCQGEAVTMADFEAAIERYESVDGTAVKQALEGA